MREHPAAATAIQPSAGHLRASDAERDRVVEDLRAHAAAGRLAPEELEDRVERALAATTRADLAAVQADLPADSPAAPSAVRRPGTRGATLRAEWLNYAFVAVVLLTIWALTGADGFWPIWPLGFWGAALAIKSTATAHHRGRRALDG